MFWQIITALKDQRQAFHNFILLMTSHFELSLDQEQEYIENFLTRLKI